MEKQFVVLYTHQKQKKAKTWHDGVLKHDGSGTKAVLYDEKGCRLDSIHLKVEDIQLGEQLESDRYFILVEEVKDISKPEPVTEKAAVTDNPKPQPSLQTTFSRARCAGLKRKNSGFMPPRMIKQACLENSQGSDTDNDTIAGMSQQDNRGSSWSDLSGLRIPPLPRHINSLEGGEGLSQVSGRPDETSISSAYPMTTVGRNVLNMYSTFGKPGNVSDSEKSSQESTFGVDGGCKRLLSPWSVYGSKNSSPLLGKGFGSQSPSLLLKPYLDKAGFESQSPLLLLSKPYEDKAANHFSKRDQVEQNQGQSFLEKSVIKSSNDENPDRNITCFSIFPETSCIRTSMDGNSNRNSACLNENPALSYKTGCEVEDEYSTVTEIDNVQKTRNLSQIMRLLRKNKTNEPQTKFGNDVTTSGNALQSSKAVCDFIDDKNVADVKIKQDETCNTNRLSNGVNNHNPAVTREILYKTEVNMNIKLKAETCYESNRKSFKECTQELEGFDNLAMNEESAKNDVLGNETMSKENGEKQMETDNVLQPEEEDNIGSFHINFSPLSFVSSGDDETEQKIENTNKPSKQNRSGDEMESSIEVSAKMINKEQDDNRNHEKIDVASTDTFQQSLFNDSAKDRTVAEKIVVSSDSQCSTLSNQNKKFEDLHTDSDVLEDIEQDFLKQTRKHSLNIIANAFPLLSENHEYGKPSTNGSNEEKNEPDKASSLGNFDENVQYSVDETENNYFEDCSKTKKITFISSKNHEIKENDSKISEKYSTCRNNDVISVGKNDRFDENEKFADNSGSVCSRTTSVSQDTMDFSCNTLEDDSQGFFYFEKDLGKNNDGTINERVNNVDQERKHLVGVRKNAGHKSDCDFEKVTAFFSDNQSHIGNKINTVAFRMLREKKALREQRQAVHVKDILSSPDPLLEQPLGKQRLGMTLNILDSGQYFKSSGLEDPLCDVSPNMTAPRPSQLLNRTRKYNARAEPVASQIAMGGVSSAVVSRALHMAPTNSKVCRSPVLEHTQFVHDSPFQRLNDSDWSSQSSPNFYIDCLSDKPLITRSKQMNGAQSSPCCGNDSSRSPEHLVKPVSQSSEEIYTQLYRPRPMYNRNVRQADTDNLSQTEIRYNSNSPVPLYDHSRGSPDTAGLYIKPEHRCSKSPQSDAGRIVPKIQVTCNLKGTGSPVTPNFFENSNEILQESWKLENTDIIQLPHKNGSVISSMVNRHSIYESQESESLSIVTSKMTGDTGALDGKVEYELNKKLEERFTMGFNQSNRWRKPFQNGDNKITANENSSDSFHQSQHYDSQFSMDLFNNETEEQYNIHNRMFNNESETRMFPKDSSQIPCVTSPQAEELDEQNSHLSPNGGTKKISRWQHFIASQLSDDIEVDLQKLTKKMVNVENARKEFVELENSPGLYITQRHVLKKVTKSEDDNMLLSQTLANETSSQLNNGSSAGIGKSCNTTECENIKESPSQLEEFFLSPNQENSFRKQVSDSTPKENSLQNVLKTSGSLKSSSTANTMSTGDSFDQLLAEDDFGFGVALGYSQSKRHVGSVEQIVPSVDCAYGDNEITNDAVQEGNEHVVIEVDQEKVGDIGDNQNKRFDRDVENSNYNHSPDLRKSKTFNISEKKNETAKCEDGNDLNGVTNSHSEDVCERNFENAEKRKHKANEKLQQNRKVEKVVLEEEEAEIMGLIHDQDQQLDEKENSPPFEVEDSRKTQESLVLDHEDRNSLNTQNGHTIEKEIENKCDFSLDESLDLTFSFDDPNNSEKPKKMSHSMRIGWKPPVKQSARAELKQPANEDGLSSSNPLNNNSASEKVKPSSKCLRLLTQSNVRIETENKIIGISSQNKLSPVREGMNSHLVNSHRSEGNSLSVQQSPDLFEESCHLQQNRFGPINNMADKTKENSYVNHIASGEERQLDGPRYKGFKPPAMIGVPVLRKPLISPKISPQVGGLALKNAAKGHCVSQTELRFPSGSETEVLMNVVREVVIPETFPSAGVYKQVLTAAITEYVNTQLLDIARKYHYALSKVDTSGYSESKAKKQKSSTSNSCPSCQCGVPSKMICVKKEGPNCGRYFYACSASRQQQCKFFQWADENRKGGNSAGSRRKIQDVHSFGVYMKDQHIHFYGECQFVKHNKENINKFFKAPKWARGRDEDDTMQKKQMLLKLPHRSRSSLYAKDDIWVISQHLDFDPLQTFLARSTFYGPSSSLEVEIEPITGYSPSNWKNGDICHAILAGNASTELSCLDNIREHIQPLTPPVLPYLLNRQTTDGQTVMGSNSGFQPPRAVGNFQTSRNIHMSSEQMDDLSRQYIDRYRLNCDQAEALLRVANMFSVEKCNLVDSILLIHGVFGAGKSFLLSVMVLFLVEVFKLNDSLSSGQPSPWKLLISSTTNVAVDRILNGLLDLGFEDFVRVGSVKKIAKPVLPYSVHASGTANQELKDLQEMLRSGELTNTEKSHVRKSIEKHRLGENKKKLGKVKVVGATCAACSLTCLNNMEFPLVLLDECSQMTEPASLLPVAKFACQKLLLVGDPKQLDPTIQGVEAAHQSGLEQTMFDRLVKMGYMPTLLRTQYRCHPSISAVANKLFYGGMLEDGITEEDRKPLLEMLPTICYFDVERGQECCERAGSYYNEKEAQFVVFLLEVLLASGIEPAAVGVITLYRSQMARISDLLTGQGDNTEMKGIQVSTVDAFQGGERDVIILSTVRTDACGFIDNDKRTNVALTRARHHLLIVGNLNNLSRNVLWGKVIDHCRSFPRGIQSADEARQTLENYLENQKTSQTSIHSKTESQSSMISEKPTRKRNTRKKRHRSESEDSTLSPANTNTTEAENNKKFPTKQRKSRYSEKQLISSATPVFSDGEDFEEQDRPQGGDLRLDRPQGCDFRLDRPQGGDFRLDRPQGGDFRLDLEDNDGFGGDCSNTAIQGKNSNSECSGVLSQSCDCRPLSLSGSQAAEETVKPASMDFAEQRRKRPRHTARLNPISSDSDSNQSDDNLPPFDYT